MSRLSPILRDTTGNGLTFWCRGCEMPHRIQHGDGDGDGPRWTWNGDAERPTFSPSILVQWHQWVPPATTPEIADKILRGEIKQARQDRVCHSFVTDGRIQYLSDCTHRLAGQTVDLLPFPEDEQ